MHVEHLSKPTQQGRLTRLGQFCAYHYFLLKLSAFDLKEFNLLTSGFLWHSTQEAKKKSAREHAIRPHFVDTL